MRIVEFVCSREDLRRSCENMTRGTNTSRTLSVGTLGQVCTMITMKSSTVTCFVSTSDHWRLWVQHGEDVGSTSVKDFVG